MTVDALLRTTTFSLKSVLASPLPTLRTRQFTVTVEPGFQRCDGAALTFSTMRSGYGAKDAEKLAVEALLPSLDSETAFRASATIVTCNVPVAAGPSGNVSVAWRARPVPEVMGPLPTLSSA